MRLDKGGKVDVYVSTGPPKVEVPDVMGDSRDEAISTLSSLGLEFKVRDVFSKEDENTVIAQFPLPHAKVDKGTTVQINVSKGLQPLTVPSVVGQLYDNAAGQLQGRGFAVARRDVDSSQPKDIVIDQQPKGGAGLARGGTVIALRLEGAEGIDDPGRDEPGRGIGDPDARAVGLRGRRPGAGHDRPEPGRDRPLPGSARRHEGEARHHGHDLRRPAVTDPVMPQLRVAIVMGGRSSEHEVSLASARSVLEALDPARYEAVTVEIGRDGRWELGAGSLAELEHDGRSVVETLPVPASNVPATLAGVDVVFPVLHGPFGEDGTVQGLLELADVPYVGAGVTASALCMDKDLFKSVLRDKGIPVTRSVTLRSARTASRIPFGFPVFVKPARLGSSVGITQGAQRRRSSVPAIALAFRHDEKVLVEEFVAGVEVECSVLGNEQPIASIPGEIVANADWYDYSSKYDEGGMELVIPPRVPQEAIERVQELSVEAFRATDCDGMARVDCFVRDDGEVLVNELNTIPGFTATSVYAKLFEASGIPYEELLERLVQLALERHERRRRLKF